jgi:hypothetical protein
MNPWVSSLCPFVVSYTHWISRFDRFNWGIETQAQFRVLFTFILVTCFSLIYSIFTLLKLKHMHQFSLTIFMWLIYDNSFGQTLWSRTLRGTPEFVLVLYIIDVFLIGLVCLLIENTNTQTSNSSLFNFLIMPVLIIRWFYLLDREHWTMHADEFMASFHFLLSTDF